MCKLLACMQWSQFLEDIVNGNDKKLRQQVKSLFPTQNPQYSSILLEGKTKYIFTLMSFNIGTFLNIRKDYMMLLKSIVHGTCGFYQEIPLITT